MPNNSVVVKHVYGGYMLFGYVTAYCVYVDGFQRVHLAVFNVISTKLATSETIIMAAAVVTI